MANKFDVPPVQSTGILMQGLGQGLVEFGNVYGATKLATIEAEAQRNKEMRLMQMENIRNNMNDAFRYASYENDQARLDLARNADARAALAEGRAERSLQIQESAEQRAIDSASSPTYTEVKVPKYEKVETKDPTTQAVTISYEKVGDTVYMVNKKDPTDSFKLQDGQMVKVSEEEANKSLRNLQGVMSFSSLTDAIADVRRRNPELTVDQAKKIVDQMVNDGTFVIESGSSNNPTSENSSNTKKEEETSNTPEPPAAVSPEVLSDSNQTADALANYMSGDYYSGDEAFKVENNNGLISDANDSQGVMSRKDDLPIMKEQPQEIVSPDDAMNIPTQYSGLLMPKGEITTAPDLGTGAYGEMPLDQPTNVSGPRLPTGDTGYMPPDNADMQYPQARKQAIDLVESLKNANLPEDVIRSELLRLIQAIPQEQANSAYAQALVDVFNELFSGNN